jgi:hypothetical protein
MGTMAMELEAARHDLGLHAARRKGRATELLLQGLLHGLVARPV